MPLRSPEAEVHNLHVFFEGWMSGRLARTEAAFAPFPAALAVDFSMVGPDGMERDKAAILLLVESLHSGRGSAFRIWIEGARVLQQDAHLVVVGYDECQHIVDAKGPRDTRRRCMAVLGNNGTDWSWRRVQETWVTPP